MSRFGIQFSDPSGRVFKDYKKVPEPTRYVVNEEPENDTAFQKGLAYWSYYTLVFATFCSLTPDLVKDALGPVVNMVY
ncbi:MAG: hypothetical protein QNJ29_07665 [Rhizobiaceae bacterium]|nr:hypothetical protein [Rhizobiaceae bacterium]